MRLVPITGLILLSALLAACGFKGPLQLPDEAQGGQQQEQTE